MTKLNSCNYKIEQKYEDHDDKNKNVEYKLMKNFDDHMPDFDKVKKVIEQQRYNNYTPNSYTNGPGYYLLNNCDYSDKTKKICAANQDQINLLENQMSIKYNFPELQTYVVGKDRSYLAWEHY